MIISARSAVTVSAGEVDLLCATADSAPPYPLRVPVRGTSVAERRGVLRAAGEGLAARGLADERGPLGVAEAFAHLLQSSTLAMDMLLTVGEDVLAAVILARQDLAVLTTQQLNADAPLGMAELRLDAAVDELLDFVPAHPAALTSPFSLPVRAITRVYDELRTRRDITQEEWTNLLAANGVTDRLARQMVTQLQPVLGNGQIGLATRGGYARTWRRVGEEVRWLDTGRGRFRLMPSGDGQWASVNPLHPADLANAVRRLAGSLRR